MPVNWRQIAKIFKKQKEKQKEKQKAAFIVKTNYQVLNMFEIATIVLIVVGFVLLGIVIFGSLQPRSQEQVAASVQLLDMNDTIAQTSQTITFIGNSMNEFYKEFYSAFIQIAVLQPESFEISIKVAQNFYSGFVNFSDQVASGYQPYNQPSLIASTEVGEVLGTMIDLSNEFEYLIK